MSWLCIRVLGPPVGRQGSQGARWRPRSILVLITPGRVTTPAAQSINFLNHNSVASRPGPGSAPDNQRWCHVACSGPSQNTVRQDISFQIT